MPEPTAGRPDPEQDAHSVPGRWSHSAVRLCISDVRFPGLGVLPRHRSRRSGPKAVPTQNNDPAPVTGTLTGWARASSTVSKAAGCPGVPPPLPHAGAKCPSRRQPGALLLQSGQTLLSHGPGQVIGGLHMQLTALAGASDGDGGPGRLRPRPNALCCVEMQLPIHPLLDHRAAARPPTRPWARSDHPASAHHRQLGGRGMCQNRSGEHPDAGRPSRSAAALADEPPR